MDGKTGMERIEENLDSLGVDALIAIGGEDTLGVASSCRGRADGSSAFPRRSTTT